MYSNKGTLLQIRPYFYIESTTGNEKWDFGDFGDNMVTSQHVKMTSRRFIKTSTLISNLDNSNPYEKSRRNSTEKVLSGIRPNGQTKVSNSFLEFKGSGVCEQITKEAFILIWIRFCFFQMDKNGYLVN